MIHRNWQGRFVPSHYHDLLDPLDPTTWEEDLPYRRLYLSDRDDMLFAIVDHEDYDWAQQWSWRATKHADGRSTQTLKGFYATRSERYLKLTGISATRTIYLHREILKRAGCAPSTLIHTIGDHRNGLSLDDRRRNLRWATPDENNRNRFGFWNYQGQLFQETG